MHTTYPPTRVAGGFKNNGAGLDDTYELNLGMRVHVYMFADCMFAILVSFISASFAVFHEDWCICNLRRFSVTMCGNGQSSSLKQIHLLYAHILLM